MSGKPRLQWVNRADLEEKHRLTMGYPRRDLAACGPYEDARVSRPEDVDDAFRAALARHMAEVEALTDRYWEVKKR